MGKPGSRKRVGRPKTKPHCSACKQRRLKCDGRFPTCQQCENSGQACEILEVKTRFDCPPTGPPDRSSDPTHERGEGGAQGSSEEIDARGTDKGDLGLGGDELSDDTDTSQSVVVVVDRKDSGNPCAGKRAIEVVIPQAKRARGNDHALVPAALASRDDDITNNDSNIVQTAQTALVAAGKHAITESRQSEPGLPQTSQATHARSQPQPARVSFTDTRGDSDPFSGIRQPPNSATSKESISSPHLNKRNSPQAQSNYQNPGVTFTVDGHIQSVLPKTTIEWLFERFSESCVVYLEPRQTPTHIQAYPIDVLIWRHSSDFFNWYRGETRIINNFSLGIELFGAAEKLGDAWPLTEGDIHYFQRLKQWIWDSFWTRSKDSNPVPLKVLVKPAPQLGNCLATTEQIAATSSQQTAIRSLPAPNVDINFRLQIDGAGKVTVSYPKLVLVDESGTGPSKSCHT